MMVRRLVIVGAMVVVGALAIALAVTLLTDKSVEKAQTSSSSETSGAAAKNSTSSSAKSSFDFPGSGSTGAGTVKPGSNTSSSAKPESSTITSDPESAKFSLHALAIGDWGVSPGGDSCCSKYNKTGVALYRDEQAQDNVAYLLSLSAQNLQPKAILSHGDNFYWNGLGKKDAPNRFADTFEGKYDQKALEGIPWFNVMGNHDYGGSAYLCGDQDDYWKECKSQKEMEEALESRFKMQSDYVSPNADRWKLPSHYYKETLKDSTSGITVDIYNVDTNAATVHGAEQVCCQCYGYLGPVKKTDPDYVNCNTVHRGHKLCFGGDNALFDACMDKFQSWTDDSLKSMLRDAQESKADWKIVNSHYSPHYHMDPAMMKTWFEALEKGGVQLFINGHTHAESHDVSTFNVHFITNGAGGGIQSESIGKPPPHVTTVEPVWSGANAPYGFFELSFSKEWMRTRFITFDKQWSFDEDPKNTVKGSADVQHCWYIPKDGGKGVECSH